MKTIKTDRLVLRKFRQSDAESMYKNWAFDEFVSRFVTWRPHKDLEETRQVISKWMERYEKKNYYNWNWAITIKGKSGVVGAVSALNYENQFNIKKIEIGYCLSQKHWNKGYATEAVRAIANYFLLVLGFNRVYARVDVANEASEKVLQKAGFEFEGILRQAGGSNCNKVCDLAIYSMLRSDLEAVEQF